MYEETNRNYLWILTLSNVLFSKHYLQFKNTNPQFEVWLKIDNATTTHASICKIIKKYEHFTYN